MNVEVGEWSTLVWTHLWQIGVLGCIVGVINFVLARRRPHLAYALWLVVLVKCFVPPVGIWPVNILGRLTPTPANLLSNATSHEGMLSSDAARSSNVDLFELDRQAVSVPPSAIAPQQLTAATPPSHRISRRQLTSLVSRAAPVVWLCGSVLLCGIAIGRGGEVHRRLRRTSSIPADDVLSLVERISDRIGLRRGAHVLITTTEIGPIVVGIRRPTVYLPETLLAQLQPPQLEAMLTHELAHVRRRDTWIAAVQLAAQTLWWFHPVVWWMNRQLVRERERSCDEEVIVSLKGKRAAYARSLLNVLEAKNRLEPLWGYPAVRPVELTRRRLEEIMKRKNMVHARAPRWCWLVAAALAVVILPSARPTAAAQEGDDTESPRAVQNTPQASEETSRDDRPPALLSYGDGKADGKMSYGDSGHSIRFEMPKGVNKIRGLRIHGSRYGRSRPPEEDFEIQFVNEDLDKVVESRTVPYRLFRRGEEKWVRVLFDKEVEVPPVFWVAINFNAHQTKGVYVSYDTSTKGEYSRKWLPGDEDEPQETRFGGDWMVQVMLSRPTS
ncbi:MAG TPA: M56 family metallopeptidase [Lacipirellulaceae bacterium]|nr:M56 family metallopeptidase [Lacipirellulaceae bacterium]